MLFIAHWCIVIRVSVEVFANCGQGVATGMSRRFMTAKLYAQSQQALKDCEVALNPVASLRLLLAHGLLFTLAQLPVAIGTVPLPL